MNLFSLDQKWALVTGASSGIGRSIALAFAEYGANLILVARREDRLQTLADDIQVKGRRALVVPCDISTRDGAQNAFEQLRETTTDVDILVNAAGILPGVPGPDGRQDWHPALDINLLGTVHMCEAVAPWMKRSGGGKIINIASVGGLIAPSAHYEVYGSTKAAVIHYTRTLAVTLAPHGIQVNCISPGTIETDMCAWMPRTYQQTLTAHQAIPRLGQVDDLNGLALYYASAASDFVTGTNVVVDGGFTLGYLPPLAEIEGLVTAGQMTS